MSYLHCHNCGWEQDDFWSEHYNPIKSLRDWEKDLLDFDKLDTELNDGLTYREVIARACENAARNIRRMFYLEPRKGVCMCPFCGANLDID